MANKEAYLSNIEFELDQIKQQLENVIRLLSGIDETLDEILQKTSR